MKDVRELYKRLRLAPSPAIAGRIGDFALYESLLAGCADRVANGGLIDTSKVPFPDHATVTYVAMLRKSHQRSHEESAFLEYFDLLEEIRSALAGDSTNAMDLIRFDEHELTRELERLLVPARTAFAAAVAERLLPAYASFARQTGRNDATKLVAILERLWLDLEGRQASVEQDHDIAVCVNLIPDEDSDHWSAAQAYAEDAVAALAYALRHRKSGQAQEAAWAARRAYDALDHFVIAHEGMRIAEARAETLVLSHPLVQAELSRQQRDLKELTANQHDVARVADRIRERARMESKIVFKPALP